MKKVWLLILTIIIVFALYGCVSVKVDWEGASGNVMTPDVKNTEKPSITSSPAPTASVHCPKIEETVIYDSDKVTVTVTGLEYSTSDKAYLVKVIIQNHSQNDISYSINWANVNGYTIKALSIGHIFGGMESDADFWLSNDELELAEIEYIQEIGFTVDFSYSDSNEQVCTASANLPTSDHGESAETHELKGTEVYSSDDYKIIAAPYSKPTIGSPLVLYIENNTEYTIMVAYDGVAINGVTVASYMTGPFVLPNTRRVELMEIYYFGDEPDIDAIDSVTLGLDLIPQRPVDYYSFYDDRVEVSPVTVLFD